MCRTHFVLALVALCVDMAHSWEIVIGAGDKLVFYTNGIETDAALLSSHNLAALAYDDVHNMILYVDRQSNNDAIGGYSLIILESKYFIERNGRNIQGIVFDSATEKLFFTDTNERSINWISLVPGSHNNVHGNRLLKMEDGIPTDIAVDSCRGYVYWITTNLTTPIIERVRFDGSEREVIINASALSINSTHKLQPHSLVIDQQTQTMFWVEPDTERPLHFSIYRADLSGQNKIKHSHFVFTSDNEILSNISSVLTVSNNSLIAWAWCTECSVWEEPKFPSYGMKANKLFKFLTKTPLGIAASYKFHQQIQGLQNCTTITSKVRNYFVKSNSMKSATEYEGLFCVHGMKVDGQSDCKCEPGYIGERCDVSVCVNYCLQGNCSISDEGLPQCRCRRNYIGERCEINACQDYCLNDGDCVLIEQSERYCICRNGYVGKRCEESECLNYCIQGFCYLNQVTPPTCSCFSGYSGERCEVDSCHGHCLNNGDCFLNDADEPACECVGDYKGSRCEVGTASTDFQDKIVFDYVPTRGWAEQAEPQ